MRKLIAAAVLGLACLPVAVSQAAVTVYAQYNLGEAGSMAGAGNLPQDSSGNGHNFTDAFGSSTVSATGGVNDGAYVTTSQYSGWIGTDAFSTLPTDNVGYGLWVKAANTTEQGGLAAVGGMGIDLADTGYVGSIYYVAFFGNTVPLVANTWTHLAMIRRNGTSTFYANSVDQGNTTTAVLTDSYSTPGLAMDPQYDGSAPTGQGVFFQGGLDDFRVVTFGGTDEAPAILGALTAVPEPTSLGLLLSAGLLMCRRSRKA